MPTKEELEEQLARTQADMKALASMAAGRAQSIIGDGRQDQIEALSEEAQQLLEEARGEALRARDAVEDRIRENPFAFTGIAFGVGLLLGSLLRR